jgi:hypothetical protein
LGWNEAKTLHHKKQACYENGRRASDYGGFLDKRPKKQNMDMRFGILEVCMGQVHWHQYQKDYQNIG